MLAQMIHVDCANLDYAPPLFQKSFRTTKEGGTVAGVHRASKIGHRKTFSGCPNSISMSFPRVFLRQRARPVPASMYRF